MQQARHVGLGSKATALDRVGLDVHSIMFGIQGNVSLCLYVVGFLIGFMPELVDILQERIGYDRIMGWFAMTLGFSGC